MVWPIPNRKILLFLWNENKTNHLFFMYHQRSLFYGWRGKINGQGICDEYWNCAINVWDLQDFCELEFR